MALKKLSHAFAIGVMLLLLLNFGCSFVFAQETTEIESIITQTMIDSFTAHDCYLNENNEVVRNEAILDEPDDDSLDAYYYRYIKVWTKETGECFLYSNSKSDYATPYLNEHIYYDADTKTLTLNNAGCINVDIMQMSGVITVNIIGDTIINSDDHDGQFKAYNSDIVITGPGTLVIGTDVAGARDAFIINGSLTMNSGTLNCSGMRIGTGDFIMNGGKIISFYCKTYFKSLIMNGGEIIADGSYSSNIIARGVSFKGGHIISRSGNNNALNGDYPKTDSHSVNDDPTYYAPNPFTVSSSATMYIGAYEEVKYPSASYNGGRFLELDGPANMVTDIAYQTHVQNVGWQDWRNEGDVSGTSGQSLRLEGIILNTRNVADLGLHYKTHVQNIGWQDWVAGGTISGTSGESLRLEAIQIELTGDNADNYDVYYQVHAQNFGWLGWAKNGEQAGTAGYGNRLEGIRAMLVPKGESLPAGSDLLAFYQK